MIPDVCIRDYVAGKTVALVSKAPTMIGSKLGEYIESFDVVARMSAPIPERLRPDMGTRTDVLMSSNYGQAGPKMMSREYRRYLRDNVKWVVLSTGWPKYIPGCRSRYKNVCGFDTNRSARTIRMARHELQSWPTNGMAAIDFWLSTEIRKLFVCGFTFYRYGSTADEFLRGNLERYFWDKRFVPSPDNRDERNLEQCRAKYKAACAAGHPLRAHSYDRELVYFRKLCKMDKRIEVDDTLAGLLAEAAA